MLQDDDEVEDEGEVSGKMEKNHRRQIRLLTELGGLRVYWFLEIALS
jgi:hypothetical protein